MIRKYKKTLILTSLLTLLPMFAGLLLRENLPEMMPTHWGFDGQPDGWSSSTTAIFVMPLIMLAAYWICVFFTSKDKSNQDRNEKVQVLVFWIIPILSNLCCGLMYALALGVDLSITNIMFAFMGLVFAFIGNYMPKCKMNSTIGIKVYWTYTSEENWNATHRLAGKIWFIGGLMMMFIALIPAKYVIAVFLSVTAVMVIVPILYALTLCWVRNLSPSTPPSIVTSPLPMMLSTPWNTGKAMWTVPASWVTAAPDCCWVLSRTRSSAATPATPTPIPMAASC